MTLKAFILAAVLLGSGFAQELNQKVPALAPFETTKKLDKYVLNRADWKCHYIIQGARPASIRSMYQTSQCFDWQDYTNERNHIAAIKLYLDEVKSAFPEGSPKRTEELDMYIKLAEMQRKRDAKVALWW